MSNPLDLQPSPGLLSIMPRVPFTKETAKIMAARSHAPGSRRHLAAPLRVLPELPASPATFADNPAAATIQRQLAEVREAILHTRAALLPSSKLGCCPTCHRTYGLDGKDRAALIKALDLLYDRERILLGIPLPGSLRPSGPSKRRTGGDLMLGAGAVSVTPQAGVQPMQPALPVTSTSVEQPAAIEQPAPEREEQR